MLACKFEEQNTSSNTNSLSFSYEIPRYFCISVLNYCVYNSPSVVCTLNPVNFFDVLLLKDSAGCAEFVPIVPCRTHTGQE